MLKKLPKILKISFITIFIAQLIALLFLLIIPTQTNAESATFIPQVTVGDEYKEGVAVPMTGSTAAIGNYIKALYKYGISIVGIVAAVVLMFGGVLWITAAGNSSKVEEAKSWITASLTGLVLALTSYMILNLVNPDLVKFKVTDVDPVEEMKDANETGKDCCTYIDSKTFKQTCVDTYSKDETECKKEGKKPNQNIFVKGGKCVKDPETQNLEKCE